MKYELKEITLENVKKITSTGNSEEISKMIFGLDEDFDPYYKKDIKDKEEIMKYFINFFVETEYEIIKEAIHFIYRYSDSKNVDLINDNLNRFEGESLFIALMILLDSKNKKYFKSIEKNKLRLPEDKLKDFNKIQSFRKRRAEKWDEIINNKKDVIYNYDAFKF